MHSPRLRLFIATHLGLIDQLISLGTLIILWTAIIFLPQIYNQVIFTMVFSALLLILVVSPILFVLKYFHKITFVQIALDRLHFYALFGPIMLIIPLLLLLWWPLLDMETAFYRILQYFVGLVVVFFPLKKLFDLFADNHRQMIVSFSIIFATLLFLTQYQHPFILVFGYSISEFVSELSYFSRHPRLTWHRRH